MIPGLNLLNVAFGAIAQQRITYIKANGRALDDSGLWVTSYDAPVLVNASWQPATDASYAELGLDLKKAYFTAFVRFTPVGNNRGASPDRFAFQGRLYEVEAVTPWGGIDGWSYALCVDIGVYTP